jgi:hypothetical protein
LLEAGEFLLLWHLVILTVQGVAGALDGRLPPALCFSYRYGVYLVIVIWSILKPETRREFGTASSL